ncbi:MAG: hypothetical protein ACJAZ1_002152 [Yoonia sp.]|jgi:hypothetical protein
MALLIWTIMRGRAAKIGGASQTETPHYSVYFANTRWDEVAVALLALIVTVSSFSIYKAVAVGADGYAFDAMFNAWGRAIFGGQDSWTLAHALLPSPFAAKAIDFVYHPAFLPMVAGVYHLHCSTGQTGIALYLYGVISGQLRRDWDGDGDGKCATFCGACV